MIKRRKITTNPACLKDMCLAHTVQDNQDHSTEINNMVARYDKTGQALTNWSDKYQKPNETKPIIGDFTEIPELPDMLTLMNDVSESFEKLPETAKNYFGGNVSVFMEAAVQPNAIEIFENAGLYTGVKLRRAVEAARRTVVQEEEEEKKPTE